MASIIQIKIEKMKTVSLISSAVVAALLASDAVAEESNSVVLAQGELQQLPIHLRQDYGDYGDEEEEEVEPTEAEEETEDDAEEDGEEDESEAFDPLLPGGEIWGYINVA